MKKISQLIFLLTLVFLFLIASSFFYIFRQEQNLKDKIYPGTYVNGMNFGNRSKKQVVDYFEGKNKLLKTVSITVFYQEAPIATLSGAQLGINYDSQGVAERAYLVGRSRHFTSRLYQKLAAILGWQTFNISASLGYDKTQLFDLVDNMKENYDIAAKNALFKFENGRVVSFRQEEKGQEIQTEIFLDSLDKKIHALEKKRENIVAKVEAKIIEPEFTLANSNDFGIEEFIGEGKSDFTHSIPERVHNLTLAASKFDGVLIPKNSVFSFNETVGDISSFTGYKPAYIIKSGKTVLGDGGGVCQVSTTLFRAALNTGLPILERAAHAYRVGYYENDSQPGFDATVYAPSPDLKIKNDTTASILIQTEVDQNNNLLYFRFYGKRDDRKVEISPVTVYDVVPPLPEIKQDDPTLKKGIVKQVDFPAWGSKAVFTYKVTKAGKIDEKKFLSVYRPWQAVYLVGTAD